MPKILKDKRIEILVLNEMTSQYEPVKTLWAHFRSLSVREMFNCGADSSWNNVYFTISNPKDFVIDTYCKIRYKNVDYDIMGLDLYEDRAGDNIKIQARCRY